MTKSLMLPIVLFALSIPAIPAAAQTKSSVGYPFCMRSSLSGPYDCRYTSFKACLRDRTGTADCVFNPRS